MHLYLWVKSNSPRTHDKQAFVIFQIEYPYIQECLPGDVDSLFITNQYMGHTTTHKLETR